MARMTMRKPLWPDLGWKFVAAAGLAVVIALICTFNSTALAQSAVPGVLRLAEFVRPGGRGARLDGVHGGGAVRIAPDGGRRRTGRISRRGLPHRPARGIRRGPHLHVPSAGQRGARRVDGPHHAARDRRLPVEPRHLLDHRQPAHPARFRGLPDPSRSPGCARDAGRQCHMGAVSRHLRRHGRPGMVPTALPALRAIAPVALVHLALSFPVQRRILRRYPRCSRRCICAGRRSGWRTTSPSTARSPPSRSWRKCTPRR